MGYFRLSHTVDNLFGVSESARRARLCISIGSVAFSLYCAQSTVAPRKHRHCRHETRPT